MSDALSFGEIDAQQVELLPARTVLSLFSMGGDAGRGGNGGVGGAGGVGRGGLGLNVLSIDAYGHQLNSYSDRSGGEDGRGNGDAVGNIVSRTERRAPD